MNTKKQAQRFFKVGNLVAISRNGFFSKLIRLVTKETYSHVAVIVQAGSDPYVVEAIHNGVCLTPLRKLLPFYIIETKIKLTPKIRDWIEDHLHQPYSIFDCILAGLHLKTRNNKRWQCAELANEIYKQACINLNLTSPTPGNIVKALLEKRGGYSCFFTKKGFKNDINFRDGL